MAVILYHHPGSLCSQKVRLALVEKGVDFDARTIDIGRKAENFEPWYVRLNPNAVVPTLVHDGVAVTDSARIVQYVDKAFDGPALHADKEADREVETRWLARADKLPLRELSYGRVKGPFGFLLRRSDGIRLRKLEKRRDENPELRHLYEAKMEDIKKWFATSRNPVEVDALEARVLSVLRELDAHLAGRQTIGGERYGVADVLWTVVLARLQMLGQRKAIRDCANVSAYYERMKARPSFARASVWERTPWADILKSLLGLNRPAKAASATVSQ